MIKKSVNLRISQEKTYCLLAGILMIIMLVAGRAEAGVALGATRVIYPAGQKQVQLAVTNNDENSTYLIQSWVENADGVKDGRFVVTPPLFAMKGKKENTLRILDATNNQLPQDRESLFWMNVKAIPSMDKAKLNENTLQLAIISRIKLYYRPAKLALPPMGESTVKLPSDAGSNITYRTINDYGALTPKMKGVME
ncbi:fimbria/pilus periplasmic chaperone [Escherichia albertii]|nr:molecular chaperone FimC [Escherichia albertii]ELY3285710.1 fimbria/pilus periplasmic chaperone [Escherichia albertii]